ncbi:hypothetical protein GCM10008932_07830 [Alkalibacterium iburiense]|uniref:Helicase Helix-turn-helix domain-containing protein n=1 Tax=Alkalibacterium iburiense TaxID=290589 RepID=A0ABN0X7W2_9LACT
MIDEFTSQYVLSQLTEDSQVTAKQLHLISQGRRTASVLFNIEKNRLYSLYSLFHHWTDADWDALVSHFLQKKWVTLKGETLQLTENGLASKKAFLETCPPLVTIDSLEYTKTRKPLWDRFIFVNQIVSEYKHQNVQYTPYLNTLVEQQETKRWLKDHGPSLESFSNKWIPEVFQFMSSLSEEQANIVASLQVGHQQTGRTRRQLRETLHFSDNQLTILLHHTIEKLIHYSKNHTSLLRDLVHTVHKENDYGLSTSTYQTQKMLEDGKTIRQISQMRKLKENTIKEHVLEMVLVNHWKGYKSLIPSSDYDILHNLLKRHPSLLYSEAKSEHSQLDFFWFRLIEIERMRRHDS